MHSPRFPLSLHRPSLAVYGGARCAWCDPVLGTAYLYGSSAGQVALGARLGIPVALASEYRSKWRCFSSRQAPPLCSPLGGHVLTAPPLRFWCCPPVRATRCCCACLWCTAAVPEGRYNKVAGWRLFKPCTIPLRLCLNGQRSQSSVFRTVAIPLPLLFPGLVGWT